MSSRFTIIVPSYNGGEYLKECVRSILAQSYRDFHLALLDDGSSDGSLEWLHSLHDPRLHLYPAPRHLGIVKNWARAVQIPKGEFMTIVGQDDLLDSNYLHVMDELIASHPDAQLYHAHFRFIDTKGAVLRPCRALPECETAAEYITALFGGQRDTHGCGYMMRSQVYEEVGGIPHYDTLLFADDALWITLMHRSYKATAPQSCFAVRRHQASAGASPDWRSWLAGMREYIPFLESIARADADFANAYRTHAPGYFVSWCYNLYKLALMQATQRNERIQPHEVFKTIHETLTLIAPGMAPRFQLLCDTSKGLRLREWVNAHQFTRLLYNMYLCVRLKP